MKELKEQKRIAQLQAVDRIRSLSCGDLYKFMKIDFDSAVEDLVHNPTGDIASRARNGLDEILRVSKISRNLNGPCVNSLRHAAVLSAPAVEVLRTRADSKVSADAQKQIRFLEKSKKEANEVIAKLRKELEETKKFIAEITKRTRSTRTGRNRILDFPSPEPEHYRMDNEEETIPMEEESYPSVSQPLEVEMKECLDARMDTDSPAV